MRATTNDDARLAAARSDVAPFHVMRVLDAVGARRRAGLPVLDLSAGQPSTPAPAAVRAAAHAALDTDRLGYTNALGIPALRSAIAQHYREREGLDVAADNVVVTTGSSGGFLLSFLAAFDVGDTVVVARPGYPAYRNMLRALGADVVELPCDASSRFQPTVAHLESLPRPPAGLVLASPANPTGTVVARAEFAALAAWCDAHGTRLISDEIYHGITYGSPATTAWSSGREAVVVNSFSKYFSMTGWRIGWLLVPDALLDAVDRLTGNFTICPPALSQHAAVAAFDAYDELDANVARYADNRRRLLDALAEVGIDRIAPPDGAFYVYADVSRWTADSMGWAGRLLDDTGVAVVPGLDFDPVDGGKFVRMCFAGDGDDIVRAATLMGEWLADKPVR
ncbi:aminotransferase class I/II-fold pyridoxal phosphate-dependent enzyme [uncultured Jatrophihabitans sp.]|uniref:aminotransferase class I/II-fold pyridoxal phosphate-dependent enzyme n=1 Tax=uncultured Jatrophihabitans sp. TaxID=1610747 RepID=UPI0035CBF7F9